MGMKYIVNLGVFPSRLQKAMLNTNKNTYDVAEQVSLSPATISRYCNGIITPKITTLYALADFLGVNPLWLMGYENEPEYPCGEDGISGWPVRKTTLIPVLGRVAAGVPIEAIEDVIDWEDIPIEKTQGGKKFFGLKVQGDSMYPKYLEGDTVIVQKASDCESGRDCVVYTNGHDATLKTVKKKEDGSIELIPYNREYPPKLYSKQEVAELPIVICGVVVELRRKI